MQILVDNRPPELDPGDVGKSFQEITRYLTSTMETIDFNLAKNRRSIMVSGGSTAGMQMQIDDLRAAIVVLTNGINGINNQIGTINNGLADIKKNISSLQTSMTSINSEIGSIKENVSTVDGKLTALDSRVEALEQKQEGTP